MYKKDYNIGKRAKSPTDYDVNHQLRETCAHQWDVYLVDDGDETNPNGRNPYYSRSTSPELIRYSICINIMPSDSKNDLTGQLRSRLSLSRLIIPLISISLLYYFIYRDT